MWYFSPSSEGYALTYCPEALSYFSHIFKKISLPLLVDSVPLLWFPTLSLCFPLNPFHWWGFSLRLLFWFTEFSFPSIVSACPSSTILCLYWIPFSCFIFTSLFQLSLCFAFLMLFEHRCNCFECFVWKCPESIFTGLNDFEISNFWRRHVFFGFHSVSVCIDIYCLQLVGEDRYGTGHDGCPICA